VKLGHPFRYAATSSNVVLPENTRAQVLLFSRSKRKLDRAFNEAAHTLRVRVAVDVWSVSRAPNIEYLIASGVDGILSDDLLSLKSTLEEHGLF
jgi:hypothetical protein